MPLYEYQCDACGERFEVIQKFSDPHVEQCRKCGKGPVQRLMSSPAIQFKGSGWYITDYAKKGSGSDASTTGKSEKSEKSDTSEKKSESAGESKPAAASTPAPSTPAKSDSSS
jgi:putative FmdB family regulatory protein